AAGHLRFLEPYGGVLPALGVPRARLRLPRARHLLRGGQGDRGGAGRALPPPLWHGRDLPADPDLLGAAAECAVAVHLAFPRRRWTAVRGLPDGGRSRL